MPQTSTSPTPREHLSTWVANELRPGQLVRSLNAGFFIYILEVIFVISFAALIFSGELSSQLPYGIGLIVIGDAILCGVVALLSTYPGTIAIEQDAPGAILALTATSIVAALPPGASQAQGFATVVVMIVGTSLVVGVFFMLLGFFKLGDLVRFLPYPVMGGFLAGTGWLLTIGGVGVMTDSTLSPDLLQADMLIRWLPGVLLGLVMLLVMQRSSNPVILPGLCVGVSALFYLWAWLAKVPVAQLISNRWLLGSFPSGSLWRFPLDAEILTQVNWSVLASHIPNVASVLIVGVIALLLNANGLEMVIKKDIDLNRELMTAGFGNLVAGLGGGMTGYHTVSFSSLNHTMSGGKRISGLFTALLLGLTAFFSAPLLTYIPKMILGGLLVFLGLTLLVEWVYQAWFKFPKIDFLIILTILTIIAVQGFLVGIAAGMVMTIILFVISYSQVRVVRQAFTGLTYRSRVSRDPSEVEFLRERGEILYILRLHGFIFFGTANSLYGQVRERAEQKKRPPLCFVVLDFAQVTGLDSTGMLYFTKMSQLSQSEGFALVLTGLNDRTREQFARDDICAQPGVVKIFLDLDHGVEWCENELLKDIPRGPEAGASLPVHLAGILGDSRRAVKVTNYLQRREFAAGEYLIHQGDDPDWIYLIESGQITSQLEYPGEAPVRLETMGKGRTVGELGFYLGIKRTAAVVADKPSVVYSLSKETLEQMEKTDPEAAYDFNRVIIHLLGERVVHMTRILSTLQG